MRLQGPVNPTVFTTENTPVRWTRVWRGAGAAMLLTLAAACGGAATAASAPGTVGGVPHSSRAAAPPSDIKAYCTVVAAAARRVTGQHGTSAVTGDACSWRGGHLAVLVSAPTQPSPKAYFTALLTHSAAQKTSLDGRQSFSALPGQLVVLGSRHVFVLAVAGPVPADRKGELAQAVARTLLQHE